MASAFSVLFVCTGNICRSPLAERLLLACVPRTVPIIAASAGTHGLTGRPIDEPTAALLREIGIDPSGHAARRLDTAMLQDVDLVLTASTEHRSTVVQAEPLLFRRAFTMREFARLGAGVGPIKPEGPALDRSDLVARVQDVADQRGVVAPPPPGVDEIMDPFGAPDLARASADAVATAVDGIVAALGLTARPRPALMRNR